MQGLVNWFRRVWLLLAVAGVVIVLDQWTKQWVRNNIPEYGHFVPIPALGDYFLFEHVNNYGAAFGILQNQGNLFVVIAILVSAAILFYGGTLHPDQRWLRVLLGLQMGGAIGNLIDRLMQGYVTDFVKMGVPGVYYWPNYNIADSAIVVSVILLAGYLIIDDLRLQRQARAEAKQIENLPAEHS